MLSKRTVFAVLFVGLILIVACVLTGCPESGEEDPTANWETFISEELGIEMRHPPDWTVNNIGPPSDEESSLNAIEVMSPDGTQFLIFPEGSYGYGLDEGLQENQSTIEVDGFQAIRRDFTYPDGQILTRIEFEGVSNHPRFRVEFLTRSLTDLSVLELILQTLKIGEQP